MSNEEWAIAAAAGQVVAAGAAVLALLFVGVQIRVARKTADLQALQEFVRSATEREARLRSASDQEKQQAFFEFLNFLEMNAAAVNGGLFHNKSRAMVIDKLCTSIVVIQENPAWHPHFVEAVMTATTFSDLQKFMERERKTIEKRAAEFRKKLAAA